MKDEKWEILARLTNTRPTTPVQSSGNPELEHKVSPEALGSPSWNQTWNVTAFWLDPWCRR